MCEQCPSPSCTSCLYRSSVIDLNNIGVSLVERRFFYEALETFQNGQKVLTAYVQQNTFKKGLARVDKGRRLSIPEVEHKLFRASLHFADDIESDEPPPLVPALDEEAELAQNCYLEDNSFAIKGSYYCSKFAVRNQYGQNMNVTCSRTDSRSIPHLVYFQEPKQEKEKNDREDDDLLSFIILHNRGATYSYMANEARYSSPQQSDLLRDRSEECFFLSRQAKGSKKQDSSRHRHAPLVQSDVSRSTSRTKSAQYLIDALAHQVADKLSASAVSSRKSVHKISFKSVNRTAALVSQQQRSRSQCLGASPAAA